MDPQQRILLEVSYEAMEDAGLRPEALAGSPVGVFVGLFMHDYENIHLGMSERDLIGPHSPTGMSTTISANRISYVYDLTGPSMIVDTACSSSLVAVHLACNSILSGEAPLALAGGVNLLLKPEMTMALCRGSFLSPEGACKSFSARADGYVRSEGCGVVVLKALSAAQRDGDPIHAVIRGTAVNQDGHSDGLTVPSGDAQQAAIREALSRAGMGADEVQYVEAHGTGTPTGDPIECGALGCELGLSRVDPCVVGSIKSNIGHTESAAGVAGLIKAALMVRHGEVLPNLHFDEPNPDIPFGELNLRVATEVEPWPAVNGAPRVAGINSFGFGGTNAHAVLSSPPPAPQENAAEVAGPQVYPLTAHSRDALDEVARSLREDLDTLDLQVEAPDLAHTLAEHRGRHPHRAALVAGSLPELAAHLDAFVDGEKRTGIVEGQAGRGDARCAFVYSGMGSQWWAMGRELLEHDARYREAIKRLDAKFAAYTTEWSLLTELGRDEASTRIADTEIAQPCIFATQVALTERYRAHGIVPEAIVGHSAGELAAFWASGILSLDDAVAVTYHRSRLQQRCTDTGRMLAVGIPEDEAQAIAALYQGRVSLGAINSATSLTLAGDADALQEIAEQLQARDLFARFVRVNVPYHSPQMDPILPELAECLAGLQGRPQTTPHYSTVTGELFDGRQMDADYWRRNVREPVFFRRAMHNVLGRGIDTLVEVAAHPVLSVSLRENIAEIDARATVVPTLRRNEPDQRMMLASLGQLFTLGHGVDWSPTTGDDPSFVRLSPYPWPREERYWLESDDSRAARIGERPLTASKLLQPDDHPLLGDRLTSAVPTWQVELTPDTTPYLRDHVVQGAVVFPGAGYVELALAAGRRLGQEATLEDLEILGPLVLRDGRPTTVQVTVEAGDRVVIQSLPEGSAQWVAHARARLGGTRRGTPAPLDLDETRTRCGEEVPADTCYGSFDERGLSYGPAFQAIDHVARADGEVVGTLDLSRVDLAGHVLHPVVLDACFQVNNTAVTTGTYLPVGIERVTLHSDGLGRRPQVHVRLRNQRGAQIIADIALCDGQGRVLLSVEGFRCQRVEDAGDVDPRSVAGLQYDYRWLMDGEILPDAAMLPAPADLVHSLQGAAADLAGRTSIGLYYDEFEPSMDALCTAYIVDALGSLGLEWPFDGAMDEDQLAQRCSVQSRHRRLLHRLLQHLQADGLLHGDAEGWRCTGEPLAIDDPQDAWRGLLRAMPAYQSEALLTQRCGTALAGVLRGDIDPLDVIFPQGSTLAEHFYASSPTFEFYLRGIQEMLTELVQRLPDSRPLRVLEVGAGTGGLTAWALPALPPERTEYVFTDISQSFCNQAARRFADRPYVEYATLDISADPEGQGFEAHSFDIVMASDAVHATADLRQTLGNCRNLLAPGGHLVLLETTRPPRWFDLVWGMLDGWWLFDDHDLRPDHVLLSQRRWLSLLTEEGFEEAAALADPTADGEPLNSVLIAQAPDEATFEDSYSSLDEYEAGRRDRPWIVLGDNSELCTQLMASLIHQGVLPTLLHRDPEEELPGHISCDPDDPGDIGELVRDAALSAEGAPVVIDLWSHLMPVEDPNPTEVAEVTHTETARLLDLLQGLSRQLTDDDAELWMITADTQAVDIGRGAEGGAGLLASPLWGLLRVSATENPTLRTHAVDLPAAPSEDEINVLVATLLEGTDEDELVIRDATRLVHRLAPLPALYGGDTPWALQRRTGASFVAEQRAIPAAEPGQVTIEVRAAALNFKDVARVTGLLDTAALHNPRLLDSFGVECAGVVTAVGEGVTGLRVGDPVMGLVYDCFASHAVADAHTVASIPDGITFEQAATLPLAFMTAYHSLMTLGEVREGQRVLVHTATGGVGLAAIQLCQGAGAEVFATAGSEQKRDLLRAMGVRHVSDSRDTAFASEILAATSGEGVDLVINTLPASTLEASMEVLRPVTGRLVELANVYERGVPLSPRGKGCSVFVFDIEGLAEADPKFVPMMLWRAVECLRAGVVTPLPYRAFPASQLPRAIETMRQAQHIGKVVVTMDDPAIRPVPTSQHLELRPDASYLISGGLGGFGLATARWLVDCGARCLVLTSRSGAATDEARAAVEQMRAQGARVEVVRADATSSDEMAAAVWQIDDELPPLRGVIHAAMVLDDTPIERLTHDQLLAVMEPKILGAWHLHRLTRDRELDFFVNYSSVAATIGNGDQGNYAAGNLFLESLARIRANEGLPCLTIDWGVIGGVGYVAEREDIRRHLRRQGITELSLQHAWQTIHHGLSADLQQVAVMAGDWNRMARYIPSVDGSPRFGLLVTDRGAGSPDTEPTDEQEDAGAAIAAAVAHVLGVGRSDLDPDTALDTLGFDSLMAVELVVKLEQVTGVRLPKMSLLEAGLNTRGLIDQLEQEGVDVGTAAPAPAPPQVDPASLDIDIDAMTDEQVDAMLDELLAE